LGVATIALKDFGHRLKGSVILGGILGLAPALLLGRIVEEGQTPASLIFGGSVLALGFATLLLCGDLIADERSRGTMLFLLSQPLHDWEIAFGKLFALLLIMAPAILVNSIAVYIVASTGLLAALTYTLCLTLYILAGGGLLLFVSARFKRLPAIFGMWCAYAILLSLPGAFFAAGFVPAESWGPAFFTFLIILPFLTPLMIGIAEYAALHFPFLVAGGKGPGAVFSLLPKMVEHPAAFLPNFFIPGWNSVVLLLGGTSDTFGNPGVVGWLGSGAALLAMSLLFGLLTAKQLRRTTPGID